MDNENSLVDILEMHDKEYRKELSRQTEISKKTRQYELILFKYRNLIKEFAKQSPLSKDYLRNSTKIQGIDSTLDELEREGILTKEQDSYHPTPFTHTVINSIWGKILLS